MPRGEWGPGAPLPSTLMGPRPEDEAAPMYAPRGGNPMAIPGQLQAAGEQAAQNAETYGPAALELLGAVSGGGLGRAIANKVRPIATYGLGRTAGLTRTAALREALASNMRPSALAGEAFGQAFGATGAKALNQAADPNESPSLRKLALEEFIPQLVTGALTNTMMPFMDAAGTEVMAAAKATPGVRRLFAPFANSLEPGAREAEKLFAQAELMRARGVTPEGMPKRYWFFEPGLTPAQATRSDLLETMEGFSRLSPLSTWMTNKRYENSAKLLEEGVFSWLKDYTGKAAEKVTLDEVIANSARHAKVGHRLYLQELYNPLDEAVGSGRDFLKLDRLHDVANEWNAKLERSSLKSLDRGVRGILDDVLSKREAMELTGEEALALGAAREAAQGSGEPLTLSFEEARQLRSALGKALNAKIEGQVLSDTQTKVIGDLKATMDEDIANSLRAKGGDELVSAWKGANTAAAESYQKFESVMVKQALKGAEPDTLVRVGTRGPVEIGLMKEVLGGADAPAYRAVAGTKLTQILGSPDEAAMGAPWSARKSLAKLNQWSNPATGDEPLKALLGKEEAASFRNWLRASELAQYDASKQFAGAVAFQLAQAGAGLAIIADQGGRYGQAAPYILLAPAAVGLAFTRGGISRWLTTGMRSMPGSATAARAWANLRLDLSRSGLKEGEDYTVSSPLGEGGATLGDAQHEAALRKSLPAGQP